jgi:2-octaprenyl-6-methoxyphenol hydroxylase
MTTNYDLIIVGGGMVGASLARALAPLGLRLAVVEAGAPPGPAAAPKPPSYDDRAIALSWGSRLILDAIGVWNGLADQAEAIRHIHVSEQGGFGVTRLDHREQGVPALGYVVDGHALGTVLFEGLAGLPGVELLCPARFESVSPGADGVEVRVLVAGETRCLHAPLLVAADGRESPIRQALGVPVREWSYRQAAVISNLTPERPQAATAFERFTPGGPLALLPMTGGRYGLVWTVPEADMEAALALDDPAFMQQIQRRFGLRLGRFRQAGRRTAYPLRLLLAQRNSAPRTLFLGNAAHALHPITGQGFNLGMRDVAVLADLLAEAHRAGADLGGVELPRRYDAWRQADQRNVALVTDGLVRLFTNPLPPLRWLRRLGLSALQLTPPIRRGLTHRFMGLGGTLPRLSRGLPLD